MGLTKKRKAQATLELSLAMLITLVILFGTFSLFLWVNKRMAQRQWDYDNTRVEAGQETTAQEHQVNESWYPKLYMFKSWTKRR